MSQPAPNAAKAAEMLPKKSKIMLGLIGLTGIVTFAGGLILALYAFVNYRYAAAPDADPQEIVFTVKKGSGLSRIAADLETVGAIESARIFKLVTMLRGNESQFKAGEFALELPASMSEIYTVLSEGKAILYPFTVAEGRTSAQIIRQLPDYSWMTADDVTIPAEGTLLPETYLLPRDMAYSEVIARMKQAQAEVIDRLWETRAEDLPIKTKQEAIILASVVEKETGIDGERDRVAGVFINRLNRGIRLQSDPTIIYGISKGEILRNRAGEQRGIRRSEIDRKTDWNTYQIDGLPKTPICNPGEAAIAAVLNPAKTKDIFFVANGQGGHIFAENLAQHNANVKQWRKIERERKRAKRQGK
jgi:UPF0755 protein